MSNTKLENSYSKRSYFFIITGIVVLLFIIPMSIMVNDHLHLILRLNYPTPDGWALFSIGVLFIGFLIFYGITLIKMGLDK